MFWLLNDNQVDIIEFDFGQIFPYYTKYMDCSASKSTNLLYKFNNISINAETNKTLQIENELEKYKNYVLDLEIKMKGNYISYLNKSTNQLYTFSKLEDFIDESNNELKLPLFTYVYNKISDNKIPNILSKYYDFYYPHINFNIYKINDDTLFVIEKSNNNIKKYIINKNIEALQNILD